MKDKWHIYRAQIKFVKQWRIEGAAPGTRPPYDPNFSQCHAVFRKIWQNHMLAPPRGLAPPPTGNLGSAPVKVMFSLVSVCLPRGVSISGGVCPLGSLSRGVSVKGSLSRVSLSRGGSLSRGSLSGGFC